MRYGRLYLGVFAFLGSLDVAHSAQFQERAIAVETKAEKSSKPLQAPQPDPEQPAEPPGFTQEAKALLNMKVAANVKEMERQYRDQFAIFMKVERSFLRRTCLLTPEELAAIDGSSDLCVNAAAREMANPQGRMAEFEGRVIIRNNNVFHRMPTATQQPETLLLKWIVKAAEEKLPADKAELYRNEVEKRKVAVKQVQMLSLIAKLDEELLLTADQRQQLMQNLSENWQPSWEAQLELYAAASARTVPPIPDKFIVPVLDDKQKVVWRGIEKQSQAFWGNIQQPHIMLVDEPAEGLEPVPEPAAEAKDSF